MQFKWWGRGNASSLPASHCWVLGEQERGIIARGAQLPVPTQTPEWKGCWKSKGFIPLHLWNKHAMSSCGKLLGIQVTQITWICIASAVLHEMLQCSYTVIKMWDLCLWFYSEISYLIGACAVAIQARLKVNATLCTVWKFSFHLCCLQPLLNFCFSSSWSRYHIFVLSPSWTLSFWWKYK